ncbi:hypothetical protein F5Y09DRAFT_352877 [Xylaria sp. FL1042]|nr:hypothetical protein F5Y09DRAFT_352877 [Xylaria sp. FL1042]
MPTKGTQDDVLGEMFSSREKRILRGHDPQEEEAKRHLITRLADALTYRRTAINYLPFDCFGRAARPTGELRLLQDASTSRSRCELPGLSHNKTQKAKCVIQKILPYVPKPCSGMIGDDLRNILLGAWDIWTKDARDRNFATIVNNIPNKTEINKVVCIGLSDVAIRYGESKEDMSVYSSTLAQYLAVMSIAYYLRASVAHEVELFAADWGYDEAHVAALPSLGFTILNPLHGKQEQFTKIDDNTMLISFGIPDCESILPIISEYARPVAMIYDAYDYLINKNHARPQPSPVWGRVEYDLEWVTIPGPPLRLKESFAGTYEAAKPESRHPFYTQSTGRMLDQYRIAMNLYKFDVRDLPSQFDLHQWHDDRLYPPCERNRAMYDEIEQRRFAGKNSRLFVRK